MRLVYLYCLLPGEAEVEAGEIEGIEAGAPVRLVVAGRLQAAVSDVGDDFGQAQLNARVRDLEWLSPRAVRHHEVVDQLFTRSGLLLPLTFGAIFQSEDSLRARLAAQEPELLASLERLRGRRQWDVRLTRDRAVFAAQLAGHSAELRAAEAELASKPPGTRFLLEKKIRNLQAQEATRVAAAVRKDVYDTLAARAVEARRDQLSNPAQPQDVVLELRASYLVEEAAADGLNLAVAGLSEKYAPLGYEVALTGPWAPFTFAGQLRETPA